jgi:hypothetical protein
MPMNFNLTHSNDTLYVLDRTVLKKRPKTRYSFQYIFYSFRVLTTNLWNFSKLGEKIKIPLKPCTNESKDIQYVLARR